MDLGSTYATSACDGCKSHAFVLRVVDGAKLCERCGEKSASIDRKLVGVRDDDPVECDACGDLVDFDARIAVVARECGGAVLCETCTPRAAGREAA